MPTVRYDVAWYPHSPVSNGAISYSSVPCQTALCEHYHNQLCLNKVRADVPESNYGGNVQISCMLPKACVYLESHAHPSIPPYLHASTHPRIHTFTPPHLHTCTSTRAHVRTSTRAYPPRRSARTLRVHRLGLQRARPGRRGPVGRVRRPSRERGLRPACGRRRRKRRGAFSKRRSLGPFNKFCLFTHFTCSIMVISHRGLAPCSFTIKHTPFCYIIKHRIMY